MKTYSSLISLFPYHHCAVSTSHGVVVKGNTLFKEKEKMLPKIQNQQQKQNKPNNQENHKKLQTNHSP